MVRIGRALAAAALCLTPVPAVWLLAAPAQADPLRLRVQDRGIYDRPVVLRPVPHARYTPHYAPRYVRRYRPREEAPLIGPSVGRNAVQAIADGLAGTTLGQIRAIENYYADTDWRDADYFAYYRRPTYGRMRAEP